MQQTNFFLRTKLLPPRPVSQLLRRTRLIEKLRSNVDSPITLVAADAGYGKTTLIADFLHDLSRPSVWYQLDHTDADPIVFLNYVAHGIKSIAPDFGELLFSYLSEANEDLLRSPERAADLLINEILESIEHSFILVLDDYHHIGTSTLVHKIVDRMLLYASEHLHVIITTRDLPPLAIMRRRTQSAALVITREDLLFTDAEVSELFKNTLGVDLRSEQISEYRDRTHGWITALQLVRQIAEKEPTGNSAETLDLIEILQRSEKDIFDYFAEEVFSREDQETQSMLLHLSLLESLPLHECSLLFPEMRCSATLPELAQKNIFLSVAGDGSAEEYRFHPLFRDFLVRRFRSEVGKSGVADERNRIANRYLENEQWELALPFLLEAENFDRAAEVIAEKGREWIAAGAITSLASFADKVPTEVLNKFPQALLHRAEIARLQGDAVKSSTLLNKAVELFRELDDKFGEAEALHSLASIARRRSNWSDALQILEKAEQLVPTDSETYLKCLNTRGLCLIAEGNWTEAEQQFRVALELAENQSNDHYIRLIAHNLALAPGLRGDFAEALRWFNRIFQEDKPEKRLPQEAIGHLNVARLQLYRGEFEKTEFHLERSLEICQLFNLRSLLPEIFESYANFYREKLDFVHASEFYERALNAYDAAGIDLATRELNEERAKHFLLRGDTAKARGLLETLIEMRLTQKNEMSLSTARLSLYRVDLAEGRTDDLVDKVSELLEFFHKSNHHYDESLAAMLLAEVYFTLGQLKEMVEPIQRVLDLSARFDYEYWLKTEIRKNRRIFEYEDIYERLPPDLREELLVSPVVLVPEPSPEIQGALTDLTVSVLGHVDIHRDPSKPFAPDAWTTRRARDIFCYVATRKHRRVQKDILIEAFWGDEGIEAIEKNFHPTISHIRKALNSRQTLKQNFIVFRDGAYQLNPEFSYQIDTEEFLRHISDAEKAKKEKDDIELRNHLEAAYDLYRGDFMEGLYENWAEEDRNFYREQYVRVINALAKLALSERRWTEALKYANQILTIDPYREDLHRVVIKVLLAQSKHSEAKRHFEEMKRLLNDELGIEPSAETKRLFANLNN